MTTSAVSRMVLLPAAGAGARAARIRRYRLARLRLEAPRRDRRARFSHLARTYD